MSEVIFPDFSKFPAEIRCLIWSVSVPGGRIVPIEYQSSLVLYTARLKPPAILHTTHESRHEGLKIYHELQLGPLANSGCYVDFTRDIVYLRINIVHFSGRFIPLETDISLLFKEKPHVLKRYHHIAEFLTCPRPGEINPLRSSCVPTRTHSKMILNDLLESDDGRKIFQDFDTDIPTFRWLQKYYQYYRHQMPVVTRNLCLIHESGNSTLPKDIVLSKLEHSLGEDETTARKLACSFRAQNGWRNKRDLRHNRPALLVEKITLKRLDPVKSQAGLMPVPFEFDKVGTVLR